MTVGGVSKSSERPKIPNCADWREIKSHFERENFLFSAICRTRPVSRVGHGRNRNAGNSRRDSIHRLRQSSSGKPSYSQYHSFHRLYV